MSTLVEFLLDRIAEDEAIRRRILDRAGFAKILVGGKEDYVDPHAERLLSDLDAKRRIVEREADALHRQWRARAEEHMQTFGDWFQPPFGATLRDLALPYADHPDYDEAWRP